MAVGVVQILAATEGVAMVEVEMAAVVRVAAEWQQLSPNKIVLVLHPGMRPGHCAGCDGENEEEARRFCRRSLA